MAETDNHGGDFVKFENGSKGNKVIGNKYDMTRDMNSRYTFVQLHQSIFKYNQE